MGRTQGRFAVVVALMATLAACAEYSLVEAKRQTMAGAYTVDPGIQWSKSKQDKVEMWTVDGPALESVRFYQGLTEGDRLFKADEEKKLPTYAPTMTASEVMEFVVDSLSRGGSGNVTATALRPADFGAAPGFRFELSFTTADGLWFDGLAIGATIDGKLHLILYSGARQHYFPKYKDEVERMIGTIRTT